MEKLLKIDKEAKLPKYYKNTFVKNQETDLPKKPIQKNFIDKVAIFPSCFVNYNNPNIGDLTQRLLTRLNIESKVIYEGCCGMPQLEGGNIEAVAEKATKMAILAKPLIKDGYKIVSIIPSCSLMLKFEWPLILPNNEDIKLLSESTFDVCEYLVDFYKEKKIKSEVISLPKDSGVTVHISCHSRAQNIGHKAVELLKIIPNIKIDVIERCSGHGGSWGVKKDNFSMAIKVGKPVARKVIQNENKYLVSECPLAGVHVEQGVEKLNKNFSLNTLSHPIELFALANNIK